MPHGILLNHKDALLLIVTTRMSVEDIMLSKVTQALKDKSHMFSLIYRN